MFEDQLDEEDRETMLERLENDLEERHLKEGEEKGDDRIEVHTYSDAHHKNDDLFGSFVGSGKYSNIWRVIEPRVQKVKSCDSGKYLFTVASYHLYVGIGKRGSFLEESQNFEVYSVPSEVTMKRWQSDQKV